MVSGAFTEAWRGHPDGRDDRRDHRGILRRAGLRVARMDVDDRGTGLDAAPDVGRHLIRSSRPGLPTTTAPAATFVTTTAPMPTTAPWPTSRSCRGGFDDEDYLGRRAWGVVRHRGGMLAAGRQLSVTAGGPSPSHDPGAIHATRHGRLAAVCGTVAGGPRVVWGDHHGMS